MRLGEQEKAFTCQRLGSSPPRCQVLTKIRPKIDSIGDYSGAGSVWPCESRRFGDRQLFGPGFCPLMHASRFCFLPYTKQSRTTPAASQRKPSFPQHALPQSSPVEETAQPFSSSISNFSSFYLFTDAAALEFHSKKVRAFISAQRCRPRSYPPQ